MSAQEKKFSGYFQVVLAAIITFTCGMSYGAYGMVIVPLAERLGISLTAAGIPATVETVGAFIGGVAGTGVLIKKWGARRCILIGAIMAALFIPAYTFLPSFILLCVWEFLTGVSMCLGYSVGMGAFAKEWFIEKRETVLGVCIACVGFGAAAGTWMYGKIDTTLGPKTTAIAFAMLGVLCLLIYLLALRTPEQIGQQPLGYEKAQELSKQEGKGETSEFGPDFKEVLKTASFWLCIFAMLFWALSMVLAPYFATILMTNGVEEMSAANFTTIKNIATAVMAIVIGRVTSKLGPKLYAILGYGTAVLGLALLLGWLVGGKSPALLFITAVCVGAGYVVGNSFGPIITTKVFGNRAYDNIITWIYGTFAIGMGIGIMLLPSLATARGNWTLSVILAILLVIVGYICVAIAIKLSPMRKLHGDEVDRL